MYNNLAAFDIDLVLATVLKMAKCFRVIILRPPVLLEKPIDIIRY